MATMKKSATVKKAQKGMTMKQLKMKYPSVDTTAKGDVRGTEINAYAPKKVLQKYNDTYNAFDRKFGNKPAKDKKGGVVKKAQDGITWKSIKDKASKVKGFGETYGPTIDRLKKATSSETIKKTYKPLIDKIKSVKMTPKQKMGGKMSKKK